MQRPDTSTYWAWGSPTEEEVCWVFVGLVEGVAALLFPEVVVICVGGGSDDPSGAAAMSTVGPLPVGELAVGSWNGICSTRLSPAAVGTNCTLETRVM
jgi:hypothetical protein